MQLFCLSEILNYNTIKASLIMAGNLGKLKELYQVLQLTSSTKNKTRNETNNRCTKNRTSDKNTTKNTVTQNGTLDEK